MTILKLFVLIITVAHTIHLSNTRRTAPGHHKPMHHADANAAESETVIENKNVNVVVNVDPKEVAAELWKIIEQEHPGMKQSSGARAYVNELEEIIKPYLTPTRRSEPTAYEIANGLDSITRRALNNQPLQLDEVDEESLTRKIVADMMKKLKDVRQREEKSELIESPDNFSHHQLSRRMVENDADNISKTTYKNFNIDLLIRIRKGRVTDASLA